MADEKNPQEQEPKEDPTQPQGPNTDQEHQLHPNPATPEQAMGQESVATEDVNKRIKPAMAIIRELMSKLDAKRESEAREKTLHDSLTLEQQNAEIVQDQPKQVYVSLDGDNIGNAVARAEEKNDEKALSDISRRINNGQDALKQWAVNYGGKVIEAGGDEGLVKVPSYAISRIEELRNLYKKLVGATATVGVGPSISESTKARMLGKLRGKNRVVIWEPEMLKELHLRMQEKPKEDEAQKMKSAGLGGDPGEGEGETQVAPEMSDELPKEKPEAPKRAEGQHRYATSKEEEDHFKGDEEDEDKDREPSWDKPHQMVAPDDEEDEHHHPGHYRDIPQHIVDDAIDRGMDPHHYAQLLRSHGNRL